MAFTTACHLVVTALGSLSGCEARYKVALDCQPASGLTAAATYTWPAPGAWQTADSGGEAPPWGQAQPRLRLNSS